MPSAPLIIELRLTHPEDLFQLPQTDLFTEYRNYLTGVELALAELRGGRISRPPELHIELPDEEITDGLAEQIERALGRYCSQRITYNARAKRGLRLDGATSLWIGLPVTAFGLALILIESRWEENDVKTVFDHLGWVFAWIGLWWPFDTMLFSPHVYSRENRALTALGQATVRITPSSSPAPAQPLEA